MIPENLRPYVDLRQSSVFFGIDSYLITDEDLHQVGGGGAGFLAELRYLEGVQVYREIGRLQRYQHGVPSVQAVIWCRDPAARASVGNLFRNHSLSEEPSLEKPTI